MSDKNEIDRLRRELNDKDCEVAKLKAALHEALSQARRLAEACRRASCEAQDHVCTLDGTRRRGEG